MAVVISDSANAKYGTAVATIAVNNGGTGYSATDVLTLTGGDANATVTVETVDGVTGAVLTVSRTAVGSGYSAGTEATSGGGGAGCTIDITVQAGLGTVNGFYEVEAHNLGGHALINAALVLSTERTIAVTFAHAGNCQGLGIFYYPSADTINRSIIVKLQENVASVWTDRASVTMTYDQLLPNQTNKSGGGYVIPFVFSSPYAVDTTASKWRFSVAQTGGSTGTWYLMSTSYAHSDAAIYYFTWCDNTVSFTNGDALIIKNLLVVDKSASITGVASATTDYGGSTRRYAITLCSNFADLTPTGSATFTWENPPLAAYTLTIIGEFAIPNNSSIRVGTSGSPIPVSSQAVISFDVSTYIGGIHSMGATSIAYACQCMSVYFYGAIPAHKSATVASEAAASQPDVVLTEDLSAEWQVGDVVVVGPVDYLNSTATSTKTISSISGTTLTLNSNLSYKLLKDGKVINFERFGIKIIASAVAANLMLGSGNVVFSGVYFNYIRIYGQQYFPQTRKLDSNNEIMCKLNDCAFYGSYQTGFLTYIVNSIGLEVKDNIAYGSALVGKFPYLYYGSSYTTGDIEVSNNINIGVGTHYNVGGALTLSTYNAKNVTFSNNKFYNMASNSAFLRPNLTKSTISDNEFYGINTVDGVLFFPTNVFVSLSGNKFNKCTYAVKYSDATFSIEQRWGGDSFGDLSANTSDIVFGSGHYIDAIYIDPLTAISVTVTDLESSVDGSRLGITGEGGVANKDSSYLPQGYLVRCGDGLTDTTVHTAGTGKFSIRFQPTSSTELLEWEFDIPTGNIQNKDMVVSCWCKINNAAYYAGTNRKPRLTINFDDGTEAYAEATATTDWQLLTVSFKPLTTYGQITVTVDGYTDATTTDAYFYIDDFSVFYPPGVQLDLGGLDLWAEALPVVPPIATNITAADVWNVQTSGLTTAGSIGKKAVSDLTTAKFLALK